MPSSCNRPDSALIRFGYPLIKGFSQPALYHRGHRPHSAGAGEKIVPLLTNMVEVLEKHGSTANYQLTQVDRRLATELIVIMPPHLPKSASPPRLTISAAPPRSP